MVTSQLTRSGNKAATLIQNLGLWVVLLATVVAGIQEIWVMIEARQVKLTDLLLLFIYLEVITMVNVYWQSGKLPVRMPLYIAMVALARYLILEAAHLGAGPGCVRRDSDPRRSGDCGALRALEDALPRQRQTAGK